MWKVSLRALSLKIPPKDDVLWNPDNIEHRVSKGLALWGDFKGGALKHILANRRKEEIVCFLFKSGGNVEGRELGEAARQTEPEEEGLFLGSEGIGERGVEIEEAFELEELEAEALGDGCGIGRKVDEASEEKVVESGRGFVWELGAEKIVCDRAGGLQDIERLFEMEHGVEEGCVFERMKFCSRDAVDPFGFAKRSGEGTFFRTCDEVKKTCVFRKDFEDAAAF